MSPNDTVANLVTRNADGSLGTRSAVSLLAPLTIDSTRNLASDLELASLICQCSNIPPFLIESLLASGYTEADLLAAGVPYENIIGFTCGDVITDIRDGQTYTTVLIGGQCWMAENLNIGKMIPGTSTQTNNGTIEKYCYNDVSNNCDTYGGLYQWDEMMQYTTVESSQGICPTGWHLPSDLEIKTLEMTLGMSQTEADMTGSRGTDEGSQLAGNAALWTPSGLTSNAAFGSSGFDALPAGQRLLNGSFNSQAFTEYFWTSTDNGGNPWYRYIFYSVPTIDRRASNSGLIGWSVRCVKD